MTSGAARAAAGARAALVGVVVNAILAFVKVVGGVFGHSQALIADGVESATDIFSSLILLGGLKIAAAPPDADHPYGHGKAESLAAVAVSLALFGAGVAIAAESVREIFSPHLPPAPFTLPLLVGIVAVKEVLYRRVRATGTRIGSTAVAADAWHHRSDALTSAAAFVGIAIGVAGGPAYAAADDWAALAACGVIGWNAVHLLRRAVSDVMDAAPPPEVEASVRAVASSVDGVAVIEKCRIRKSGLELLVEIHVQVDPEMPVRRAHAIGHAVKDALLRADLEVLDVLVHIEPAEGPSGPAPLAK